MKRVSFLRTHKIIASQRSPLVALVRSVNSGPSERDHVIAPKHDYVRSRKLLDACGLIPCQRCGAPGAVGAHSNWAIHGKGRSIKADDNRIAALCSYCHHDVDQGNALNERGKKLVWWSAHERTVHALQKIGKWPAGVPVPDLRFPAEWL